MLFAKDDRVVFIGDSITDCGRARPVGEGLGGALGTGYVADIAAMLGAMAPESPVRVINMGVSGNRIPDLKARWQTDVIALHPHWVCVMIGINDVWRQFDSPMQTELHVSLEAYERIYRELIEQTLPLVKGMVLITPFYIEPNPQDAMRARMDAYSAVVRGLAAAYGLPLVDVQAAWDALLEHMYPAAIAWDRVHPNHMGHVYLAKTILKGVGFQA